MSDRMAVYPLQNETHVDVGSTPSQVTIDTGKFQVVESTTQDNPVVIQSQQITILTAGIQGPPGVQGPAGGEEAVPYAERVDFVGATIIYRGEATVGTLDSAPLWRVRRITLNSEGDATTEWADGNSNFDNIWDNRASLSYS